MKPQNAKWLRVIFVIIILLLIGKAYKNKKEDEKLDCQRDAARQIKETVSGLEQIKFDQDGGHFSKTENDFGKWSTGAKLKLLNSSWYDVEVSTDEVEMMEKGFPDKNMQGGTNTSVKVIYSNDESEIIE